MDFNKKAPHIILIALCVIFFINDAFGQQYIDMTRELSNINGHLAIDGNGIQSANNNKEDVIIIGDDMVVNDRSSFVFHNVIVQLSGKIVIKGKVKPVLFDSYVFCKNSGGMQSPRIIEKVDFSDVVVSNVGYIKKILGNPQIWIYNSAGKRVFKGSKQETKNIALPIARYDVKIVGKSFESKILFY